MRQLLFDILLLLSCSYSLWRGGAPERTVSIGFAVADLLSIALVSAKATRFHHEEWGLLGVDMALLGLLVGVSLKSLRWWPLPAAGLQAIGVLVHTSRLILPGVLAIVYFDVSAFWSYPMLLILALATWRHQRRLMGLGVDPAWMHEIAPRRPRRTMHHG